MSRVCVGLWSVFSSCEDPFYKCNDRLVVNTSSLTTVFFIKQVFRGSELPTHLGVHVGVIQQQSQKPYVQRVYEHLDTMVLFFKNHRSIVISVNSRCI